MPQVVLAMSPARMIPSGIGHRKRLCGGRVLAPGRTAVSPSRANAYVSPMMSLRLSGRSLRLVPALAVLLSCDGNAYDKTQIPLITLTPVVAAPLITIAWQPAGAQQVRVYKGTVANGQSDLLMWSITGTGKNSLVSGIEYGTTNPPGGGVDAAAKPLVAGQPYTVQVSRVDPKGGASGGLTSTGARYQNTQTFTMATIVVPP